MNDDRRIYNNFEELEQSLQNEPELKVEPTHMVAYNIWKVLKEVTK